MDDIIETNTEEFEYHSNCDCYLVKNLFIDENSVRCLRDQLMSLPFTQRANDFHCLSQTEDFSDITELPNLARQFVNVMKTQVKKYVDNKFNIETKEKITMTASMYKKGDYLLCHDDLYSDRIVAFVYYLSDNWTEVDGGSLRFFEYDEDGPLCDKYLSKFVPMFNSLILFRVSVHSFHEVEEVFGPNDRLSINGWYHGVNPTVETKDNFVKSPLMTFTAFITEDTSKDMIQSEYCQNYTRKNLRAEVDRQMLVLATDFLADNVCKQSLMELQHTSRWKLMGSPMHRRYETLEMEFADNKLELPVVMPNVKKLVRFLVSEYWQIYLNDITGLEFAVLSDECVPPACIVEIQKWSEGSYSVVTDNDVLRKTPSIEVTVFLEVNKDVVNNDTASFPSYSGRLVRLCGRQLNKKTYKRLYLMKLQQAQSDIKQNFSAVILNDRKLILLKKLLARRKHIIQRKMMRIEQHRNNLPQQTAQIMPTSNSVLIAINSAKSSIFTPYICHGSSPLTCQPRTYMYSVNITYMVTSTPDV